MVNFGTSKDSEYWSFPLPPISPHVSSMKSSASSMDVRALKSQVKVVTYILRKLWLSSACTTCTCISKTEGGLLGIPLSALQSRMKGMSGGFCKHFLRSFRLFWLWAKLRQWVWSDWHIKIHYDILFRRDFSHYFKSIYLFEFVAEFTHWSHVLDNLCTQSALFACTVEFFKSMPRVLFVCLFLFFNSCETMHGNYSVTDKISLIL